MKRRNRDVYTSVIYPQILIPHPRSAISLPHITRFVTLTLVWASPSVPAMITSHPNTTMARKGQTKELNCTARGEQPIIIRWERGDTVIDAERNPRYSITINKKGDEVISTLKVRYGLEPSPQSCQHPKFESNDQSQNFPPVYISKSRFI